MVCCGVASALTITEDTTMAPAANYYAGPFDFTLTIQDISGYTDPSAEYLLGYYAATNASGGYSANVFTLNFDGNGNATLSLHRVDSVTVTDGAITAIGTIKNSSVFKADGSNSNYTLGVGTYKVDYLGGGNGSAAADLYLGDVKVASFTGGYHNMNGGGGDGTATLNVTVGSLTVNKAIPEPATATLSLLALAGLAARRRRK